MYGNETYVIIKKKYIGKISMASNKKAIARIEARVSPETKALFQKAAILRGSTLTDFIVATVEAEACRVIEQHQTLKLSMEESEAFVDALVNPPQPNDALNSAGKKYKEVCRINGSQN